MVDIRLRVILPSKQFSDIRIREAIERKQRMKTGPEIKKMFEGTVDGWEHKPNFFFDNWSDAKSIGTQIQPYSGSKYELVVHGSPPHTIIQKRGGFLRFRTGYRPSTTPGSLQSQPAQRFGNYYSTGRVSHPGFKARQFDYYIARDYRNTFERDMQDAVADAVRSW